MLHADKSFWLASAGEYQPSSPLMGNEVVDVAIIGGGFTGLSTAYHVRQSDPAAKVALLEAECIAFGASGRTSGWVVPMATIDIGSAVQMYGFDKVVELQDYAWSGAGLVARMIFAEQMNSDYEATDLTFTYHGGSSSHIAKLYDFFSLHDRAKDHVAWLDKAKVSATFNTGAFDGGMRLSRSAQINPVKHARELKRVVQRAGVQVYEMTPVLDVEDVVGGFLLRTPSGELWCKKLVIATNGYTHLLPASLQLERTELPMSIYQLITEPLTPAQFESLGWSGRQQFYDKSSYFPPTARFTVDGRLQFNWCNTHFISGRSKDEAQRVQYYDDAQRMFQKIWPVLEKVNISHRWSGICSAVMDVKPQIGTLHGGKLLYAFGYAGAGITMSHAFGATLADLALERDTEQTRMWWVKRDDGRKSGTLRRFPAGSAAALRGLAKLYYHRDVSRARKVGIY